MSIVGALVFVILALVLFFDLVQPEYGNMEALKGQAVGQKAFLASETTAVAQAQQLISEYQSQSQGEQNAALAMPTGADIAGALAQAYGIAQANNIVIQTISVSTPTLEAPATPTDGTTLSDLVKPLGTLTLQITAAGSYESLQGFLSGLETNIRIFDLKGISIQPAAGAASGKGVPITQDLFTYALSFAVYYQTP